MSQQLLDYVALINETDVRDPSAVRQSSCKIYSAKY